MSEESKYVDDVEHVYVAPNAPKFYTRLTIGNEDFPVQFANGTCTLSGKIAQEFDRILAKPGNAPAQHVRKVDRELGEKIARAHMEEFGQRAAQGPFNTNMRQDMLTKTLAERAATMQAAQHVPSAAAEQYAREYAGDNMALQELVDPKQAVVASEAVASEEPAPAAAPAAPAKAFSVGAKSKSK